MFGFILVPVFAVNNLAYGAFDADGKYYCDPKNMSLEEITYKAAVNRLNYETDSYLSLNPSATYLELRNYLTSTSSGTTESTYDILVKSEACLHSNGIDPLSIATSVNLPSITGFAPEFGTLAGLAALISILGVIIITSFTRKINDTL